MRLVALFLLIAGSAVNIAHACTSAMQTDINTNKTASWRIMDLPELYFNSLAWVPAGFGVQALPVAGGNNGTKLQYSSIGPTFPVKYSFVCVTSTRPDIQAYIDELAPGSKVNGNTSPGVCSDGMNTAGLAASALMQLDSTGINTYSGTGAAVEQNDFIGYLLATYATAAEVLAAFDSGSLQVVLNPALEKLTQVMFSTNYSMLHYVVYDKYNQSAVIEYSGPNNLQWYNNTVGALANNPLYPEQVSWYQEFLNYSLSKAGPTIHGSDYYIMPGGFNSSERFTKAIMLKQPANVWNWTDGGKDELINPGNALPGLPSTNPNLLTNIIMIRQLWLPKGVDDSGGIQIAGGNANRDISLWVALKDHAESVMYLMVANTPKWRRVDLANTNWAAMTGLKYADLSPGVWWEDINPTYTAFIGSSPGPSPASGGGSAPSPSGSKGPYKLPILSVYTALSSGKNEVPPVNDVNSNSIATIIVVNSTYAILGYEINNVLDVYAAQIYSNGSPAVWAFNSSINGVWQGISTPKLAGVLAFNPSELNLGNSYFNVLTSQGEIRGQFIVPKASKAIGTFLAAAASHQSFNFTYKGKPVDVVLETSASSPPAVSAQIIVNNKKKYLTAAQIQEVLSNLPALAAWVQAYVKAALAGK